MRRRGMLALLAVLIAGGCGGSRHAAGTTTPTAPQGTTPAPHAGLRVGVVGPLRIDVDGVTPQYGSLDQVAGDQLVLVDARVATPAVVARAARAHPTTHFALVGSSARGEHVPNLAGLVLRTDTAAYLAGVTAALAVDEAGTALPRVAWVGPEERKLANAFARGVRATSSDVAVLHQSSRPVPALCKEAALTAIGRGALLVMADGGLCAEAAASAAHEQNLPALRLDDFLQPQVAAGLVAQEATGGIFHGGDVLFGPETGAVGVFTLDPRISLAVVARARAAAQDLARRGGAGG